MVFWARDLFSNWDGVGSSSRDTIAFRRFRIELWCFTLDQAGSLQLLWLVLYIGGPLSLLQVVASS